MTGSKWVVWRHAEPKRVLWGVLLALVLALVFNTAEVLLGLTGRLWAYGTIAAIYIIVVTIIPPRKSGT